MKFTREFKGLFVTAVVAAFLVSPIQSASADNNPADTKYHNSIVKSYDTSLYTQLVAFNELQSQPGYTAERNSKQYAAWKKKALVLLNKIKASAQLMGKGAAGPSYAKSHPLAKAASAEHIKWVNSMIKYLNIKVLKDSDNAKIEALGTSANESLKTWSAQYQIDLDYANIQIPAGSPTISFNTFTNTDTNVKSLQAFLSDNSGFYQSRWFITEYSIEWYYKDLAGTPITSTAKITDPTQQTMVQLDGVYSGDVVGIKVMAKNEKGSGPWSALTVTTVI